MLFHVVLLLSRLFAGVVALLTEIRFLATVRQQVILQTIVMTGRVTALLTCEGLFSSMFELVHLEILSLTAHVVTLLTPERFLS